MKGYLLDVNVLLALAWPNHVHHGISHAWFRTHRSKGWATCLVTQLGFVRLSSHPSLTSEPRAPGEARDLLRQMTKLPSYQFWQEPTGGLLEATETTSVFSRVLTHNGVTDGYLVALAQLHRGKLATLDSPLARVFRETVELIS